MDSSLLILGCFEKGCR